MRDLFRQDPVVVRADPESKEHRVSRILDSCLDEIRSRRSTVSACLAAHPEEIEQLEPLLQVAAELSTLATIQPSSDFKAATRKRLLQLDTLPVGGESPVLHHAVLAQPLLMLWKPILIALALLAGLGLALAWVSLFFP